MTHSPLNAPTEELLRCRRHDCRPSALSGTCVARLNPGWARISETGTPAIPTHRRIPARSETSHPASPGIESP